MALLFGLGGRRETRPPTPSRATPSGAQTPSRAPSTRGGSSPEGAPSRARSPARCPPPGASPRPPPLATRPSSTEAPSARARAPRQAALARPLHLAGRKLTTRASRWQQAGGGTCPPPASLGGGTCLDAPLTGCRPAPQDDVLRTPPGYAWRSQASAGRRPADVGRRHDTRSRSDLVRGSTPVSRAPRAKLPASERRGASSACCQ